MTTESTTDMTGAPPVGISAWLGRIVCGDNTEILCQMPPESVDLVVASPPYDDMRAYGGHSWDFYGVAWGLKLNPIPPPSPSSQFPWKPTAPPTESVTQVSPPHRISAVPDSWKRFSQAAFLFVAASTSPCVLLPSRNRFGFSPDPTSTVIVFSGLPVRRRITLAEARKRALAALDLAEERRRRLRDGEARRWQLLNAIS